MRRLLLVAGLLGCSAVEPQDVESEGWITHTVRTAGPETTVLVLVVDDRPSGAQVREDVAAALPTSLEWIRSELEGANLAGLDPAAWSPSDYVAIVVSPSAEGSARFIGPSDAPALAQLHEDAPEGVEVELASTIAEHLVANAPEEPGRFRPLQAVSDLAWLLAGNRAPVDEREAALLSDARGRGLPTVIHFAIAAATDDEGTVPIEALALPPFDLEATVAMTVAASLVGEDPAGCYTDPPTSRIGAWMAQQDARASRPCAARDLADEGPFALYFAQRRYGSYCTPHPILDAPDGSARCRMAAFVYGDEADCDADRGFRDPIGTDGERSRKTALDPHGREARLCEVRQLEGAALEACQTTAECDGCGSGFCRWNAGDGSPAPWVDGIEHCPIGSEPARFRFVGGSVAGVDARFQITCDLDMGADD